MSDLVGFHFVGKVFLKDCSAGKDKILAEEVVPMEVIDADGAFGRRWDNGGYQSLETPYAG